MNEPRAFFVVGVGRSGTSLLQSMLAAHPELAIPPETGFLRRYGAAGTIRRLAQNQSQDQIALRLSQDDRLGRLDLSMAEVVREAAKQGPLSDVSVYRQLLRAHARAAGKPHLGDKDPRLIEHLALLHEAYPHAAVVHIIRDPRDVLASKKKADWSSGRSVLRHVFAYRVQLAQGRRDGPKWFGERYVELTYESLLARPEAKLRELCAALDLRFDAAMLKFSSAARRLVAPDEVGWKHETMGPLLKTNTGKWREHLADSEVALVELACADGMRQFDYASSRAIDRLGVLQRLEVRLLCAVVALATPAYRGVAAIRRGLARGRF